MTGHLGQTVPSRSRHTHTHTHALYADHGECRPTWQADGRREPGSVVAARGRGGSGVKAFAAVVLQRAAVLQRRPSCRIRWLHDAAVRNRRQHART